MKVQNGGYGPTGRVNARIYGQHADQLLESGHAFRCFCTSERLDELRKDQMANKEQLGYDSHCLSQEELPSAWLIMNPRCAYECPRRESAHLTICCVARSASTGRRLICTMLLKPDGMPTYHLANVVNDHLMKISHVIRSDGLAMPPSISALSVLRLGSTGLLSSATAAQHRQKQAIKAQKPYQHPVLSAYGLSA